MSLILADSLFFFFLRQRSGLLLAAFCVAAFSEDRLLGLVTCIFALLLAILPSLLLHIGIRWDF